MYGSCLTASVGLAARNPLEVASAARYSIYNPFRSVLRDPNSLVTVYSAT